MDDATVEAIAAEREIRDALAAAMAWVQYVRALTAAALPDPRPTEAEALRVLDSFDGLAAVRELRDLGCFRPEPAACTGDPFCKARPHVHGCLNDHGNCDAPEQHGLTGWMDNPPADPATEESDP